jgi:hypothetical protein
VSVALQELFLPVDYVIVTRFAHAGEPTHREAS